MSCVVNQWEKSRCHDKLEPRSHDGRFLQYDQHARHTNLTLIKVNLADGMVIPRVSVVKLTLGSGSVISELLVQYAGLDRARGGRDT